MAPRAVAITAARRLASPAGLVGLFVLAPLAAVIWYGGGLSAPRGADWAALRFTIWQAVISAALSCALAVPLARALHRRRFWGRALLLRVLGAPFILPVIVAILGLLAVFGRGGLMNTALATLGLPPLSIYGLHGILLAHVFFNLPLATRALLERWAALPEEQGRLAQSLNLNALMAFWVLEYPLLRKTVPGVFALIFTICLTSFAVALTLGGGPRATTLELAIYQAFRFDFDLPRAAMLALLQLAVAGAAAWAASRMVPPPLQPRGLDRAAPRLPALPLARVYDGAIILASAAFLLLPLALILLRGGAGLLDMDGAIWQSALNSLGVALISTLICVALALSFGVGRGGVITILTIALSPLILGIGLFILLRPYAAPATLALPLTALANALMALPFALRIITPARVQITHSYAPLAQSLRMNSWAWGVWVLLPRLRPALGFAAGLTAALSMGDLGVITLFSDPNTSTLPMHLYRLMGSYRQGDAAAVACLLLILSLGAFWLCDRLGGRDVRPE